MKKNNKLNNPINALDVYKLNNDKTEWNLLFESNFFKIMYEFTWEFIKIKEREFSKSFDYEGDEFNEIIEVVLNLSAAVVNRETKEVFTKHIKEKKSFDYKYNEYFLLSKDTQIAIENSNYNINLLVYKVMNFVNENNANQKYVTEIFQNFCEITIINDETVYITRQMLIIKKEVIDTKHSYYQILAQIEAIDRLREILKVYMSEYNSDIIKLNNKLNIRKYK